MRILIQDVAKAMSDEMSVLVASRLMVLLQKFPRRRGHRKSTVKNKVMKRS